MCSRLSGYYGFDESRTAGLRDMFIKLSDDQALGFKSQKIVTLGKFSSALTTDSSAAKRMKCAFCDEVTILIIGKANLKGGTPLSIQVRFK